MYKNKCWLIGLYLVYGSRLHVNVLIGQLLYLRCNEPQPERACGGGVQKGPPVCFAQDIWEVVFGPIKSVAPFLETIAK